MFGLRGNRANLHKSQYYPPYMSHIELGIDQDNWRQLQHPYYPTPTGNMGSFNNPYYQPFSNGSENMYPNAYPSLAVQGLMPSQFPFGGYPMGQQGMQMGQSNFSQSIFQNPLDPETGNQHSNPQHPYYSNSMMNPYPKQSFIPKQPSGVQSVLNSFKGQDGSIDINKMMNTAGQMMNAVNQVSSLVKGLGGIIKV